MAALVRTLLGLTQERLAQWLGVARATVALAERGHQPLPPATYVQDARLRLAHRGLVYVEGGDPLPAPPPLPAPIPDQGPPETRLKYCQHQIHNLRYTLELMQERARPFEARLKAMPALRAWTGPVSHPVLEENWLAQFEAEATTALLDDCGKGPQKMLQARIAGLEREAEVLQELVDELSEAPSQ